jgi:hypothetical protein
MIEENQGVDQLIGRLEATDEDQNDTFSFQLVSGEGDDDNDSFIIEDGDLVASASFNFEEKAS